MENQRLKELAGLITEKKWSGDVKTKWKPEEGLFTKKAGTIVKALMDAPGGAKKAMSRLNFFINRAGDKLENKEELEKAKEMISKKIAAMKEEQETYARRAGIILEKKKDVETEEEPDMDMGDDAPVPKAKGEEEAESLPKIVKKIAKKSVGKDAEELEELLMKVYDAGRKDGKKEAEEGEKKESEIDEAFGLNVASKGASRKPRIAGQHSDEPIKQDAVKAAKEAGIKPKSKNPFESEEIDDEDLIDVESAISEDTAQIQAAMSGVANSRVGKPCMTPKGKGVITGIVKQAKTTADGKAGPYVHSVTVKMGDNTVHVMPANQVKLFKGKMPSGPMLPKSVSSTAINSADKAVAAKATQANQPGKAPSKKMFDDVELRALAGLLPLDEAKGNIYSIGQMNAAEKKNAATLLGTSAVVKFNPGHNVTMDPADEIGAKAGKSISGMFSDDDQHRRVKWTLFTFKGIKFVKFDGDYPNGSEMDQLWVASKDKSTLEDAIEEATF